jgi:hypothetical protein
VLVVGGLGRDGRPFGESNTGPQIGLRAKAEGVCSTYAFGLGLGASCTSWAGPPVAEAAARLRGLHPDWRATQVVNRLELTARAPYARLDAGTALR